MADLTQFKGWRRDLVTALQTKNLSALTFADIPHSARRVYERGGQNEVNVAAVIAISLGVLKGKFENDWGEDEAHQATKLIVVALGIAHAAALTGLTLRKSPLTEAFEELDLIL